MSSNIKPGIVRHVERGVGLARRTETYPDGIVITFLGPQDLASSTTLLDGWENVDVVKPGHVQVRVDDLDPQTLSEWSQWAGCDLVETALLRVGCASVASQVAQGDPTADEPEIVGDGCECWVTPEHMWTTYGSAVEPGSQVEYNPRCPKHGEQPTTATVTLPCPDCGRAITRTAEVWTDIRRERRLSWATFGFHTCPPEQPDEPTEPGVKWRLDGKRCVRDASMKGSAAWLDVDTGLWLHWGHVTSHVEGWGTPGGQDAEATLAKVKRLASHPDDKMTFGEWHRALLATLGVSVNDVSASVRRLIGEGS